jgi:uncharacterized protein YbjT (DUF2867 family)
MASSVTVVAFFGATGNIGKDLLSALSKDPRCLSKEEEYRFLVFTRDPQATKK